MLCLDRLRRRSRRASSTSRRDEQVDPADTILEADGTAARRRSTTSSTALADKQPGDTVELSIDRPGAGEQTVTVVLSESPEEPDRTIVGFQPVRHPGGRSCRSRSTSSTDDIGGPSAGLAFTLALIDQLSPGQLTGGRNVAVTGTIGLDGTVGPIGGLAQKVSAVAPERCRRVPGPGVAAGAERPGADADADRCGPRARSRSSRWRRSTRRSRRSRSWAATRSCESARERSATRDASHRPLIATI